jgi:hypothetical protein
LTLVNFRFPGATGWWISSFAAAASAAVRISEKERLGSDLERRPLVADAILGQLPDQVAEGPAVPLSELFDLFVQVRLEMYSDNLGAALG